MIKCPNCGSTAQIQFVERYHYTPTKVAEKYECGCGATIIYHYELNIVASYTDVKKLTALLYDKGYKDLEIEKIVPAQDGIAIYTTYHTVLYVHRNGFIQEFERDD